MKRTMTALTASAVLALTSLSVTVAAADDDGLASWNDGPLKDRILAFVEAVSDSDGPDFVPVEDRIAVFDVDGTLWAQDPFYLDAEFAVDRVAELAPKNPDWADKEPFAGIVAGDLSVADGVSGEDFAKLLDASYGGATRAEFEGIVEDWFASDVNNELGRVHASNAYLPMLELLDLFEDNEFTSYLVTGAEEEFIRSVSDEVFGVPRERVIGTVMERVVTENEDGTLTITQNPIRAHSNNDEGKVIEIFDVVGREPIFAAGNSDGDYYMMKWATSDGDPALAILVKHDDGEREFEYSWAPELATAAVESDPEWAAVSMKDDWSTIFAE